MLHAQTLVQRDGALQLGHTSELQAGAHSHPAHKEHSTRDCSHLRRFAPKEMKIEDISFTALFSASSCHTYNWIKYFSVKHGCAHTNSSMQDQDTHDKHVSPVEIFCAVFSHFLKYIKMKQIKKKNQIVKYAGDNIRLCCFILSFYTTDSIQTDFFPWTKK